MLHLSKYGKRYWRYFIGKFSAVLVLTIVLMGIFFCRKGHQSTFNEEIARQRLSSIADNVIKMYEAVKDTNRLPRSLIADSSLKLVSSADWTSGFFPGLLWLMFDYTKEDKFLEAARRETGLLEKQQFNTRTHDIGFMMFCSYGNGWQLTHDENYKQILIQSAKSLAKRFNPKTGCIKSWDHGHWQYPVIIDNMMNLELLFWAARQTGDSTFYHIAVSHANETLKNHFRADYSSFHVLDYDTLTGEVIARQTHQGLTDSSAWARGQSWGLHGFTTAFRETKNPAYLNQAQKVAEFLVHNDNLPDDKIPYWDYDAPPDEKTPRDASAAAIMASALLELSQLVPIEESSKYFQFAEEILASLSSRKYFAANDENRNFILKHCVGSKPHNSEVDAPLIYADYYYTEALMRYVGDR